MLGTLHNKLISPPLPVKNNNVFNFGERKDQKRQSQAASTPKLSVSCPSFNSWGNVFSFTLRVMAAWEALLWSEYAGYRTFLILRKDWDSLREGKNYTQCFSLPLKSSLPTFTLSPEFKGITSSAIDQCEPQCKGIQASGGNTSMQGIVWCT